MNVLKRLGVAECAKSHLAKQKGEMSVQAGVACVKQRARAGLVKQGESTSRRAKGEVQEQSTCSTLNR